ncbi:M48 family metallopeptidase [Paracrocinitomix mangrovi]|uniref:M48 family metallopeptidase n=1 Tax=Paracrocinitomix mangrovi TaxID=2862509 RepID=UPI001C8E47B1|nr:M48 family metallopeptidase [Paracrocinitomix mangrovi]UKN03632.1 M48 family metallopeptidase [Paracrocinitomix mangrovi]
MEHAKLVVENELVESLAHDAYKSEFDLLDENYKGKKLKALKKNLLQRKEYLTNLLANGELIIQGTLHSYVQSVLDRVAIAAGITEKRHLFIVRNESPNAFNMGDNNVFVHLGLIFRSNSEEELAFVLGHELGHNEMHHYRNRIVDYADLALNDSINKRISLIKSQEYGRVSALNELMIPWILANKSRSRKNENDADDFGYDCVLKAGYNLDKASRVFSIFDLSDHEYDTSLLDLNKLLFLDDIDQDFTKDLKPHYESSLGEFVIEKDTLEDLLRTHPFSAQRKVVFEEKLGDKLDTNKVYGVDPEYTKYKYMAEKELIIDALQSGRLDRAIFYSLHLIRRDSNDCFARMTIPFSFCYLGYEKIKRRAGKRVETHSSYYDDSFNHLIFFLREISPEKCFAIADNWNKHFKDFLGTETSNPSMAILDVVNKDYENFIIRYGTEFDRINHYYIKTILTSIKTENNL